LLPDFRSKASKTQASHDQSSLALQKALTDLEQLIVMRPELEPAGRALAQVLEASFRSPAQPWLAQLEANSDAIGMWLDSLQSSGKEVLPALESIGHCLDHSILADRALAICEAIANGDSPSAGRLHQVINSHPRYISDWLKLALRPSRESLEQAVLGCGAELDPTQVESVLRLAVLPALAPGSELICARLTEGAWPRGTCPVCGSAPALAESRGLEQRRRLRCDRCAADWPWQHFLCPFCRTSDHRSLRYEFAEGEQDRYRLAICDSCGGRIKIIATLAPISPPGLLVAELAAIHLDFVGDSPV
jgi:hypothetical protein